MKEKDIQTLFSKKIQDIVEKLKQDVSSEYQDHMSFIFELKICKENRFLFSKVAKHQIDSLLDVNSETGVYHKISDSPIYSGMKTRFTAQKPFDCFFIRGRAYVVICWYKPSKLKELHFIDILGFCDKQNNSKMKSMTYEESKELSTLIYELNAKTKNK